MYTSLLSWLLPLNNKKKEKNKPTPSPPKKKYYKAPFMGNLIIVICLKWTNAQCENVIHADKTVKVRRNTLTLVCRKKTFILGWTVFMNSEYWLGRDEVTWDEAKVNINDVKWLMHLKWKLIEHIFIIYFLLQLNCMTEDAKLVEIGSYAEDIFVRTLAKKLTSRIFIAWLMINNL